MLSHIFTYELKFIVRQSECLPSQQIIQSNLLIVRNNLDIDVFITYY